MSQCYPQVDSGAYVVILIFFWSMATCSLLAAVFTVVHFLKVRHSWHQPTVVSGTPSVSDRDPHSLDEGLLSASLSHDDASKARIVDPPLMLLRFPLSTCGFWWNRSPSYSAWLCWWCRLPIIASLLVDLIVVANSTVSVASGHAPDGYSDDSGKEAQYRSVVSGIVIFVSLSIGLFSWKLFNQCGGVMHSPIANVSAVNYRSMRRTMTGYAVLWLAAAVMFGLLSSVPQALAACDALSFWTLLLLQSYLSIIWMGVTLCFLLLGPWMCVTISTQISSIVADTYGIVTGDESEKQNSGILSCSDGIERLIEVKSMFESLSRILSVFFTPLLLVAVVLLLQTLSRALSASGPSEAKEAFLFLLMSLVLFAVMLISLIPVAKVERDLDRFRTLLALLATCQLKPEIHATMFTAPNATAARKGRIEPPMQQSFLRSRRLNSVPVASNMPSESSFGNFVCAFSADEMELLRTAVAGSTQLFGTGIYLLGYHITYSSIARICSAIGSLYAVALQVIIRQSLL